MGTTLTGTTPQDTYDSLIKVTDNGPLSGTAKYLSDGLGNDSVLALSTSRVGVGNTAPAYKLDVTGDIRTSVASGNGSLYINNSSLTSKFWTFIPETAAGETNLLFFYGGTGAGTKMTLTNGGNVGIGTSSPDNVLDLGSPSQGRGLTFDNYSNIFSSYSAGDLVLSSNFYGNTASDSYLTSTTATFGAAGIRISGTQGPSTSGQIQFFANAAASKTAGTAFTPTEVCRVTPNGLTFNGDTAAANALDDYEEGTWTPVLRGAVTAGTYELSTSNAVYTKIGRQVILSCEIVLAAVITGGGTTYAQITGLPFAKGANQQAVGAVFLSGVDYTGDYVVMNFISSGSVSTVNFSEITDNTTNGDLPISGFSANDRVFFSITYNV